MGWYRRIREADASTGVPAGVGGEGAFQHYEGMRHIMDMYNTLDKERGRPELGNDQIVKMKRKKRQTKPLRGDGSTFSQENDTTYYNPVVHVPYEEGDRIRDRRRGLAHDQRYGKVRQIKNDQMFVDWDDASEDEVVPLNQPQYLAAAFEKA